MEKPIGVYILVNENNEIVEVNSDIFIKNFEGYIKIDEGYGDKFAHAQSQYFSTPLNDENGTLRYLYKDNKVMKKGEF